MENQNTQTVKQVVIIRNQKSMGLTLLLAILFGPLGMLYSTIIGGIVMIVVNIIIAFITLGFGLLLTWPICVIWAAIATNNYNKQLMQG